MRPRNGAHFDAPHALTAVNTGIAVLFKPKTPGGVGKDHEFGNQKVNGGTALAGFERHMRLILFTVQNKAPLNAAQNFGLAAHLLALGEPRAGKVPEKLHRTGVRDRERVIDHHLIGDLGLKGVVAQICFDGNAFKPRFRTVNHLGVVADRHVKRHAGHKPPLIKACGLDPGLRQHRGL